MANERHTQNGIETKLVGVCIRVFTEDQGKGESIATGCAPTPEAEWSGSFTTSNP